MIRKPRRDARQEIRRYTPTKYMAILLGIMLVIPMSYIPHSIRMKLLNWGVNQVGGGKSNDK